MKQFLFAACLALSATHMWAQTSVNNYEKSVFRSSQVALPNSNAATTRQKVMEAFPAWTVNIDNANGNFTDIYGPSVKIPGTDLAARVAFAMDNQLKQINVDKTEWNQTAGTVTNKASFANFEQVFNGHKVVFAKLNLRFASNGNLVRVQMSNYGKPVPGVVPVISNTEAANAAVADLHGVTIASNNITADWVWFPVPSDNGYELHPAWEFHITGTDIDKKQLQLNGYIDALDGTLLYRNNEIKETYTVNLKANVYKNGTLNPPTDEPLIHLGLSINGKTYYTDTAGNYTDTALLSVPGITSIPLQGLWSTVVDYPTSITPVVTDSFSILNTSFLFPITGVATDRHINAYYHVNRVHDFMKMYYPSFKGMDISLPTNIDLTTGTCNAFYNGSSINFYAAGGGCYSFANIGDIIYHEYGHGISDKFYSAQGAGTIRNGALNEANSDIWAISITHNPILGQNSMPGGGLIRRYDQAPKVYPQDIVGEVHADGEIIAGIWWDVAVNLGSVDSMTKLFTSTYYDVPDGPNGTEGKVYHDVLISALMSDDTDANINNGTPHFIQIVKAFARHGIYLLNDATLTHTELSNQPSATPITVNATLSTSYLGFFKNITLYYRKRGTISYDSVLLTTTNNTNFTAQIPMQQKGAVIDYYFTLRDTLDIPNAYFPVGFNPTLSSIQVTLPYQFGVGLGKVIAQTFETPATGWQIGSVTGDDATRGIWTQAVPIPSYATINSQKVICQTGADHTTGSGQCLITGNAPSATSSVTVADVQMGTTTTLSPVFDLTRFTNPVVEYYRWYGNDRGLNRKIAYWSVQLRDSGSVIWRPVEKTNQADYNWRRRIFAVKELLPTSGKYIQLRFTASNLVNGNLTNNGQAVVEAGVDDFYIYDLDSLAITSVSNIAQNRAAIYPNPATSQVTIDLGGHYNGSIVMYSLMGQKLYSQDINSDTRYTINTQNLVPGEYMIIIQTDKSIQSHKITVLH